MNRRVRARARGNAAEDTIDIYFNLRYCILSPALCTHGAREFT